MADSDKQHAEEENEVPSADAVDTGESPKSHRFFQPSQPLDWKEEIHHDLNLDQNLVDVCLRVFLNYSTRHNKLEADRPQIKGRIMNHE